LVRASVFQDNPLDEMLPYWGQDLDWSYRVRQNGWKLAACSEIELGT
jgi:GT2 family glycosyltransferase